MPKICKAVCILVFLILFCVWILYLFLGIFLHTRLFFSSSIARISFCHANLKGLEQDLLAHTLHPNDTHDLATRFFLYIYSFKTVVFTLSITPETHVYEDFFYCILTMLYLILYTLDRQLLPKITKFPNAINFPHGIIYIPMIESHNDYGKEYF